jgi:hypothetical protein
MNPSYHQSVLARLEALGVELPGSPPAPAGLYEPFRLHRGLGFLAAQVPGYSPELMGQVGAALTPDQGRQAARLAALNALGRIQQALQGFDRLEGLLHLAGHVASAETFRDQPWVLDGASELFVQALGDRGKHSRTAYSPLLLPRGLSIELEITFAYQE